MATIINIAERSRSATRDQQGQPQRPASCEIVIFPGVRYERWQEDDTPPAPRRKRKRRPAD